ncbi:ion channel [Labilibacter marinus]|uniref:ion channel n=1 Tax=Labilibacter marinus TaxID=1477105 RepID=UPI0008313D13|nr:ion channel [Labilibacter marinus]
MLNILYKYRFEIFLVSQIAILFGSLVVTTNIFTIVSPALFYLNILAGSIFIGNPKRGNIKIIVFVLVIVGGVFAIASFNEEYTVYNYLKIIVLFLFHSVATFYMIRQIWWAKLVNKNVIVGLISGFISLGFIGFFICISIEILYPSSFSGISIVNETANTLTERLMYFSYITLMTIGYGDILPITLLAQKATILIGLIGQFYMVIITAIVVGKFINQQQVDSSNNNH